MEQTVQAKGHSPSQQQKELLNIFSRRQCQLSTIDERHWTVIGHGSIGAKAEELRAKTWAIEAAGFLPNPRIVLAMGFFEEFRKRSNVDDALKKGAPSEELQEMVWNTPFTETQTRAIRKLAKYFRKHFPGAPLAVRSSAHGDSRGTGIYQSVFCKHFKNEQKTIGAIMYSLWKVLASEFSESAIAFRKNAALPCGMAVMLEPVAGQSVWATEEFSNKQYKKIFGSLFGGLAYTSTAKGKGFAQFTAGLPTMAVNGEGVIINEGKRLKIRDVLFNGFHRLRQEDPRSAHSQMLVRFQDWKHGQWIDPCRIDARIYEGVQETLEHEDEDLSLFFNRLRQLESLVGKPQYVEWAMAERDGVLQTFILQLADATPKMDFVEFPQTGDTLITGRLVKGTGTKTCNHIVYIRDPEDLALLSDFNSSHADYIIIFLGKLTFDSKYSSHPSLEYHHLSNSSVVIEIKNAVHARHPASHFGGALEESGKLFFVASEIDWNLLREHDINRGELDGFGICPLNTRVTASERQQKAIVEILADPIA